MEVSSVKCNKETGNIIRVECNVGSRLLRGAE